ncbi:MAG TPA: 16S rRNA (guanine(527)-N(7))-methyltransferase RsmG [Phototrophicaceae bacterium]|nr:16S rRNA (guanine(527)-N(7))-methyltransferase RsmG [Phototrophicaceae bacterium]
MATLIDEASAFGLPLTPEQQAQFDLYARELAVWNEKINLTAITDFEAVRVRHFLDSLTILKAVPLTAGQRVIDVGTGAGFPGLPLRMVCPEIHLALLEATGKKIAFLQHMIDLLQLTDVTTINARAEDAAHDETQRATYDVVLARAVARLPSLLEYLLPFAKVGGLCVAMKGHSAREEADDSIHALTVLGGRIKSIETFHLPGVDEPHHLVIIEKIAPTPRDYPRKPGIPTRKPL